MYEKHLCIYASHSNILIKKIYKYVIQHFAHGYPILSHMFACNPQPHPQVRDQIGHHNTGDISPRLPSPHIIPGFFFVKNYISSFQMTNFRRLQNNVLMY